MKEWVNTIVSLKETIRSVMHTIDSGELKIAIVVDENNRLSGTVTDGDIRRAIIKGLSLDEPVHLIMNKNPTIVGKKANRKKILQLMKTTHLKRIPVVDDNGIVIGLETLDDLIDTVKKNNLVVLMAGGLGTRLHPLTESCPKPLLKIGNRPILETIIGNFIEYGFRRFYISVNYKSHMVKEYFGDGSQWNVKIDYINEEKKLGTAGSLRLLVETSPLPLIVMNGDLLTKVNIQRLLDFHHEQKAQATMCVKEFDFQVPFGVVSIQGLQITKIDEKPIHSFFVNAGIYILEPDIIRLIPISEHFDMTSLFKKMIGKKKKIVAFPVREYWVDIGQIKDFKRANWEFNTFFGK